MNFSGDSRRSEDDDFYIRVNRIRNHFPDFQGFNSISERISRENLGAQKATISD